MSARSPGKAGSREIAQTYYRDLGETALGYARELATRVPADGLLAPERREALHQARAARLETAKDRAVVRFQEVERGQRRRHALDIAVVGAAMHHALGESIHEISSPGQGGHRKAVGDSFAESGQVRGDPEKFLRTSWR